MTEPRQFFEAIVEFGAILSGFCATFLAFRIQREASYFRQPAVNFGDGTAKDVYIGLTHFSSPYLLLCLGTLCSFVFGVLIPVLALAGSPWALNQTRLTVGGIFGTVVLIGSYFFDEMVHYEILSRRLLNDAREWKRETPIVLAGIVLAILVGSIASFVT